MLTKRKMDIDSLFEQICVDLKTNGTVRKSSDKFRACSSDPQRVSLVLGMKEVTARLKESLQLAQQEISKSGKSQNLSTCLRLEGNSHYQKKQNFKAISSYNQSLVVGEGESLALAFANRSAVFHDTGDWLHSLRDIQLALDLGYPKHLEHKLRERQGHCWSKLGDSSLAFSSYNLARNLLASSENGQQPDKLASIVSKLTKLGDVKIEVNQITNVKSIEEMIIGQRRLAPELNRERNPLLPCASASIELSDSFGRGRCLVATEDLKPGKKSFVSRHRQIISNMTVANIGDKPNELVIGCHMHVIRQR